MTTAAYYSARALARRAAYRLVDDALDAVLRELDANGRLRRVDTNLRDAIIAGLSEHGIEVAPTECVDLDLYAS